MRRYARQHDNFRCVPVAVLNILKWLRYKEFKGCPVNYKLAQTVLSAMCTTTPEDGSSFEKAINILRSLPEIEVSAFQDIRNIPPEMMIKPNQRICLVHNRYDRGNQIEGHAGILMYHANHYYTALNWIEGETWSQIHEDEVCKHKYKIAGYLLTKKNSYR